MTGVVTKSTGSWYTVRVDDKTVIDFPAGNGITTNILKEIGAKPIPFDLFPEYFNIEELEC